MIEDLKKIELHVHLDGSVRPSTVAELKNISLDEAKNNMIVQSNNPNLTEYLTKFDLPLSIMQSTSNLTRIAKELSDDLAKDNVIYAEVRFAPLFHKKGGLTYDEIIESVLKGFDMNKNVKVNLILCMMRGQSFKDNMDIIKLAYKYFNKGVVALDLAGDEYNYKTENYEKLFQEANKFNIPFTIHAGEADSYKSVDEAIKFGAKRIGHGVRSIENEDTIKNLIKKNITLEVCPTSNIQTKVVNSYKNHPIKKLIDNGVLVTINTDNRTVSNLTLTDEYNKLMSTFGFSLYNLKKFNINAVKSSFANETLKNQLLNTLMEK